ncbi:MAG: tRNA (adenosine(37)-N6)-threonylcarbamoyltransferase complex transferase subunit TsaD [Candidatus Aminicenantes bacterium]|nr:tRNA (adenosine(37)-N6)-threonylcarbamoyltransferase complex transferase subunit TsaD [Candidatus Aminicenantes bacterium]
MYILGIETSCDETSASVLKDDFSVLSNVILSQDEIHAPYGGVVPELASRKHINSITYVVDESLRQAKVTLEKIDVFAVTQGPGLIGSLLVGLSFAKALSFYFEKPLIPVDHLQAHIESAFIENKDINFPLLALLVSGGHTSIFFMQEKLNYQLIGKTRDDAAGEAFDKIAKFLDLGYPGGPIIDKLAENGDSKKFHFSIPRMTDSSLDFSFSGLKTAALRIIKENKLTKDHPDCVDFLASFEEAIVRTLIFNLNQAAERFQPQSLILSGGVARNRRLRKAFLNFSKEQGIEAYIPSAKYCTDNAAMVAALALEKIRTQELASVPLDLNAYPRVFPFKGKTWKK